MEFIIIIFGLFLLGCWSLTFNVGMGLQIIFAIFSPVILCVLVALIVWGVSKLFGYISYNTLESTKDKIAHWIVASYLGLIIAWIFETICIKIVKFFNVNLSNGYIIVQAFILVLFGIMVGHRVLQFIARRKRK